MAIGDSAGILFRIKADGDQASSEIKKVKGDISSLDTSVTGAAGGFNKFAAAGAIAVTAIAAVSAVAVQTAVSIFNLAKAASDYGSAIYDASQKTGLSTRTISALRLGAEQAGASFEQVTKGVTLFGITVGEAANGSVNAQEKLAALGVTSTDLDTALSQVFTTINNGATDTDKLALATAAFGKRIGPDLIPLIKDANGSLSDLKSNADTLGLSLSGRAAKAADDFGDALGVLTTVATQAGYQFVTEFMPQMTSAMDTITRYLIENKATWSEWGRTVNAVISGTQKSLPYLQSAALTFFNAMVSPMRIMTADAISLGNAWDIATLGLSRYLRLQQQKVADSMLKGGPIGGEAIGPGSAGGDVNIPTGPLFSGGGGGGGRARGGGGGGGGGSAKSDAEQKRREAVDAAERRMRDELEIYAAGSKEAFAIFENELANKRISQKQYALSVAAEREKEIANELKANQQLLGNQSINLNESERAEILQRIKVLEIEIRVEKLKSAAELADLNEKEAEAARRELEAEERILAVEKERALQKRQQRQYDQLERDKKKRDDLIKKDYQNTIGSGYEESGFDQLYTAAVEKLEGLDSTAAIAGIDALKTAFEGLGQAVGSVVEAWVLYGSAGASVQQVTAQILAAVAKEAAVKAIFQLAEGFAKLAMAIFGVPNAGPSAAAHFQSAAIYASIAGIAAVAGRGVAGDSFKKDTGKATGQNSGAGSDREPKEFSRESDNTYQSGSNPNDPRSIQGGVFGQLQQEIVTLAQATEKLNGTVNKLDTARPGDILTRGMAERPGAIGKQLVSDIGRNASIGRDIRARSGSR